MNNKALKLLRETYQILRNNPDSKIDYRMVLQTMGGSISYLEEDEKVIKEFLSFGHPREGSIRYHKAWEKINNIFKSVNILS